MEGQGSITIAQYLCIRLKELGIDHAFGVPGDYVLGLMNEMHHCKGKPYAISLVNTCNELNAANAADGYARIRGAGCLITTYGVGELSAINGVAGSYAERVPVVTIVGYPATELIKKQPLLHHTIGEYKKTKKMFKLITCSSILLKDADTAIKDIDKAFLEMKKHQRPIYIGIPCDLVNQHCIRPISKIEYVPFASNQMVLNEAVNEAVEMLNKASRPVIVADVELHRYKLEDKFKELLEKSGIPFATLMMGKTVLDEEHPLFIGLYQGKSSREYVKDRIEKSDCVLMLGVIYSDLNTGNFSMNIEPNKSIIANYNKTQVRNHFYENISLSDFISGLSSKLQKREYGSMDIKKATEGCVHRKTVEFMPKLEDKLTVKRIFDRISHFIPENAIVLADTGVSLWAAAEVLMPKGTRFIGQIFYGSIGYTIGAVIGVCFAAPERPVILFIGDGSFQETAQDLSTMIRYNLHPTIFLLNNDGYSIERAIVDGPFNDIQPWKYFQFPQVMGGSVGHDVHTEGQLEVALHHILERKHLRMTLVELHTARNDYSEPLKKAGAAMAKENYISPVASH